MIQKQVRKHKRKTKGTKMEREKEGGGNTPDPRGEKGTATPVIRGISAWTANGESAKLGTVEYSTVA